VGAYVFGEFSTRGEVCISTFLLDSSHLTKVAFGVLRQLSIA